MQIRDPALIQAAIDLQVEKEFEPGWHREEDRVWMRAYWADRGRELFGWPLVIDGEVIGEPEPVAA
jgi:hypothetical protein